MVLNARNKGSVGEREAIDLLNSIISLVLESLPCGHLTEQEIDQVRTCIQRNQNQTAVGGQDLVSTFGISFEIKRCETLLVDQWWGQTLAQAARNHEYPVLLYRKNRQPWRALLYAALPVISTIRQAPIYSCRAQIEEIDFKTWFFQWVFDRLMHKDIPRRA